MDHVAQIQHSGPLTPGHAACSDLALVNAYSACGHVGAI